MLNIIIIIYSLPTKYIYYMLRWLTNGNKKDTARNTKIHRFNSTICSTYQEIINKNFKYVTDYKKQVKQFQNKCHNVYIKPEDYDKDNLCHICLSALLGPCYMFTCNCCLTIHDGCMLRYILAGYKDCPICHSHIDTININAHAEYPATLSLTKINENFNRLLHDEDLNVNLLITDIKKNNIVNKDTLHKMYS